MEKRDDTMTPEAHKPVIETILNTCAIALTGFGIKFILDNNASTWDCLIKGSFLILFGASLEFIKYLGRKRGYW